jgi:hypothetical protein
MKRFFAYEEYGAHWTTMSEDFTTTCRGLHGWQEYERGVEALSKVVASENNRTTSSRKALSFPDLLIKVYPTYGRIRAQLIPLPANPEGMQVSPPLRRIMPSYTRLR